MSDKRLWISKAIKHPGALRAAAKRKKMSVSEYCDSNRIGTTGKRRCALAKTLRSFHH